MSRKETRFSDYKIKKANREDKLHLVLTELDEEHLGMGKSGDKIIVLDFKTPKIIKLMSFETWEKNNAK